MVRSFFGNIWRSDDDDADKLSRLVTMLILVVIAAIVAYRHGDPDTTVTCHMPAHFTQAMNKYATEHCWYSTEYYETLDLLDPRLPVSANPRNEQPQYAYYHWVPMLLLIQAFLFYVPRMLWKLIRDRTPANLTNTIRTAASIEGADNTVREKITEGLARQIGSYMQKQSRGEPLGTLRNYLVFGNVVTKLLYMIVAVVQILFINKYAGNVTGWEKFSHFMEPNKTLILAENETLPHNYFPDVVKCDYSIEVFGNLRRNTVQCRLNINYLHRHVYVFIWWWLLLVVTITSISLVCSLLTSPVVPYTRRRFVKKYLEVAGKWDGNLPKLTRFSSSFMRQDGIFVLRLVAIHSDDVVVSRILAWLWDHFEVSHDVDPRGQYSVMIESPVHTSPPEAPRVMYPYVTAPEAAGGPLYPPTKEHETIGLPEKNGL